MNRNNLEQIFQNYINKYELFNYEPHTEYYKWQVCQVFPGLMSRALETDDDEFPRALYAVKRCTKNIIDSYTQPLSGLVDMASEEPSTIRQMLKDLYSDDGGDISIQMKIISDFFAKSAELLDKYHPGSFLYKQNSHSVSALLFLNDPDHHYMYKADQSKRFADCVEFYDDWGTGDNIKLDKYYRMCDELVYAVKNHDELLDTDARRFDGRLKIKGGILHPDTEKHILAFDIIYCCQAYDLFDGISYTKRNMKEKQIYIAKKAKAVKFKQAFDNAKAESELLQEALDCFTDMITVGDEIRHIKYGMGVVKAIDRKYISIAFTDKETRIDLPIGIANRILSVDKAGFANKVSEYENILKRYKVVPNTLEYTARDLEPYEEYLD